MQNGQHLDRCRTCKQHWADVWVPAKKKNRSRSKSQNYAKGRSSEKATQGDEWQVFQEKVPWIQSTPMRSTTYRIETPMTKDGKELQLPPQPNLPPPPPVPKEVEEVSLSAEEQKLLEHLRGLSGMGMDLPTQMVQQLQGLEQKEQRVLSAKALSHGHLNRLNRLKQQVGSAAKRIKDLDSEWNAFMERTMTRVREHAALFQGCRSDLLEAYNQKLQELHSLKEEVSMASKSLIDQTEPEVQVEDMPLLSVRLAEMQSCLAEGNQEQGPGEAMDSIDLTDLPVEDEELMRDQEEAKDSDRKRESLALKPFRSAASPTGVAKTHLKGKTEKDRLNREVKTDK